MNPVFKTSSFAAEANENRNAAQNGKTAWARMTETLWPSERAWLLRSKMISYQDGKAPAMPVEILRDAADDEKRPVRGAVADFLGVLRRHDVDHNHIRLMRKMYEGPDLHAARTSLDALHRNGYFGPLFAQNTREKYVVALQGLMERFSVPAKE